MNNQVIEVLDLEHGQKVKAYFESKGVKTYGWQFNSTVEKDSVHRFYGFIGEEFDNYDFDTVLKAGAQIITLPTTTEYPKVMWVSDYEDFLNAKKRVVFMEKCGKYLTWIWSETLEDAEKETAVIIWKYAKDIEPEPEPQIVELTIEDISAGKGVGVPAHLIRIKK